MQLFARGGTWKWWTSAGAAAAVAVAVLGPVQASAQDSSGPAVTPAMQVTSEARPGRAYTNSQIHISPKDPNTLVIAHAEFATATCLIHVSRDGGRTWAQAPGKPTPPQYKACTRPAFGSFMDAAFGPDGTLYFASTGADSATNRGPTDGYLARSSDLGKTWQFTVVAKAQDREFTLADGKKVSAMERFNYARVAADPNDPKRVSVGFRLETATSLSPPPPVRSLVAMSTDGGATFPPLSDPIDPSLPQKDLVGSDAPAMAFGKDGALYSFTKERPRSGGVMVPSQPTLPQPPGPPALCKPVSANPAAPPELPNPTGAPPAANEPGAGARLVMSKSTDDGKTWKASVIDDGGLACPGCLTIPEVAIDQKSGAIHVAFELSESSLPRPRDNRDIFAMTSTDGGATWSKRLRLNDDEDPRRVPNYDQYIAGISVAPNGRVDVAWYDMRTDALYNPDGRGDTERRNQTCWDVYSTSSSNGGKSFGKNLRVSDRTMNQNSGFALNLAYDLRAPIGVASTDETTFVVWPDSRNGTFDLPNEDTYLASVVHAAAKEDRFGVKPLSVLLGAALGLLLAGLALFAFSRRRRPAPAETA